MVISEIIGSGSLNGVGDPRCPRCFLCNQITNDVLNGVVQKMQELLAMAKLYGKTNQLV